MTEYSRMARGSFTSTGAAKVISLPFQPDFVEFWNYTSAATPANHGVPHAVWDVGMGQGFAVEEVFNGTPVLTTDVVTLNGISTFSAGLSLQFGPKKQIIGATAANPIVVNVANHGYSVGDVVVLEGLYQSPTTGMPQIAGIPFAIIAVGDANHFTIFWNGSGSNYTALSGSPTGAFVMKVLNPYLYQPGDVVIEGISTGTTTSISTTTPHNYVVGQQVGFRIPAVWGSTYLNELPNTLIPGSPVTYTVVSVTSPFVFVVNLNSTGQTAFTVNVPVANVPGLTWPQAFAVGDINSGGVPYSGGALYPPPFVSIGGVNVPTINGPAVSGAFFNNTRQGFVIGAGAGTNDTASVLVGANGNVIFWRAFLHDLSV